MIAYSELLRYIKSLAESEEYINTSTMGEDLDLNKGNIFPLFNVEITGASFTSNRTVTFDVSMVALDVRSINKESEYKQVQGSLGSIVSAEIIDGGLLPSGFPDSTILMMQHSTSGMGTGSKFRVRVENQVGASIVSLDNSGSNFAIGDTINICSTLCTEETVIRVNEITGTIDKEVNVDKFYGNDNEIDNHNATISVLNNIWVKMHRDFANNNITASDNPTLEQITYSDKNLLDGWSISFTVELPTSGVNLCVEC